MEKFSSTHLLVWIIALCTLLTSTSTSTGASTSTITATSTLSITTTPTSSTSTTPTSATTTISATSTTTTASTSARSATTALSAATTSTSLAPPPTAASPSVATTSSQTTMTATPVFANFAPFGQIVNLPESTYGQKELIEVVCTATQSSHCRCNINSVVPTQGDKLFDVWTSNKIMVYYVGTSGLDYTQVHSYFIEVGCTDSVGRASAPATRILEVDIRPNQPPQVSGTYPTVETVDVSMQLHMGPGAPIHTVSATDPEGDAITYSMTQSPNKGYFTIGQYDGVIRSTIDLRAIPEDTIMCSVTLSSGRHKLNPLTITIKLQNHNIRPIIANLPATVNVTESASSGHTLITLSFSDPDNTQRLQDPQCSIDPPAESYKFVYNSGTRKLQLNTVKQGEVLLDFETTSQYIITCTVFDGFLYSEGDVLTVRVLNENEPPVFDADMYYCSMYESRAGVSSCDLGLTVTDPELNTIPTMGLLAGNNSDRFRYERITNKLSFNVDYDVDNNKMPTNVIITIYAVDSFGARGTAKIAISILDANDNTCSLGTTQAAHFTINQGTKLNVLGSFMATDDDLTSPNNQLTFEVVSALPTSSLNYLTVFGNGEIKYVGLIPETEHGKSFSLVVRCKDGGSPSLSATATVQVSYLTTTTTSTTPKTTKTTTITSTTTTTTQAPDDDIWDEGAFVGLFALLMILLVAGLVFGLWYLFSRLCPGLLSCKFQGKTPKKVEPARGDEDDFFRKSSQHYPASPNYREVAWRTGDNFESGLGYDGRVISNGDTIFTGISGRRALPAPKYS